MKSNPVRRMHEPISDDLNIVWYCMEGAVELVCQTAAGRTTRTLLCDPHDQILRNLLALRHFCDSALAGRQMTSYRIFIFLPSHQI